MWQARFLKALPGIEASYPKAHWLFLTLTVRNCPIAELRSQIRAMNEAWQRLIKRKEFGAVQGWIRTVEVTKGQDGLAHPHFHCLLMVKSSYFKKHYVKHERWIELWQECARLNYRPSVHIQTVKLKPGRSSTESPLRRAVAETLKYSVKPEDLTDRDWLLELTKQVHRLRFIASGGALKDILRETEETERDLLLADEDAEGEASDPQLFFDWHRQVRRYVKR
jgi:plasmid rolling circle replication initiator protein Rep